MSPLPVLRQSAAELLALAIMDLFPGALLVEAVTTEHGFYCDLVAKQPIDDYAIPLIEEKMRALTKQNIEVRALDMMREVGANYLLHKGQPFRAAAAATARSNMISLLQIGDYCDYCEPPYIQETQEVSSFKIFNVEKVSRFIPEQGMIDVKRVHGIVSTDKQSLKKMVKALHAGKKSNHLQAGSGNSFSFTHDLSEMAPIWKGDGLVLKNILADYWKNEHKLQGFDIISSPPLIKEAFARKAGVDTDTLTVEIDEVPYIFASSATPAHLALFQENPRSHRELPIRYAECASIFSPKQQGNLWGIFDSRLVNTDIAHIFCLPQQVEAELISSLQFIDKNIKIFGFEYYWYFKRRGRKLSDKPNRWDKAIDSFDAAFKACGFIYEDDPQESAFAGPTAETRLIDRFGREWNGPMVSLDLEAPRRVGLHYEGADGKKYAPLMIKRSLFGSLERFTALLLEHNSGKLPLWLAPEQTRALPGKAERL